MTILNFLDYKGVIKIDGVDLSKMSHRQLRRHVTTISQDPIDMEGTVRFNLCPWGDPSKPGGGLNPASVDLILDSLGLWEPLRVWEGLETDVSSLNLSDGQRRLISVARGMLRNLSVGSNLVIMDDITRNLDPEAERAMVKALMDAFDDHTVFMEAPTREWQDCCDIIIHMAGGRIVDIKVNQNGPAAIKIRKEKKRKLAEARRLVANHDAYEASGTVPDPNTTQPSAIGPVPMNPYYRTMIDVIDNVPGARLEPPHQEEIIGMRTSLAAVQATREARRRLRNAPNAEDAGE